MQLNHSVCMQYVWNANIGMFIFQSILSELSLIWNISLSRMKVKLSHTVFLPTQEPNYPAVTALKRAKFILFSTIKVINLKNHNIINGKFYN